MMAIASFWTQEFLEEVADALEVSLGRVTVADLASTPTAAALLEKAQVWLRTAKVVAARPPSSDKDGAELPPFPLNGDQLRMLQRAVDDAAQARTTPSAASKAERIVNDARKEAPVPAYVRLREGLERVRISSRVLAFLLLVICVVNVAELFIFQDIVLRSVFALGVFLSLVALTLWARHYVHLSNHRHYVEGIGARI